MVVQVLVSSKKLSKTKVKNKISIFSRIKSLLGKRTILDGASFIPPDIKDDPIFMNFFRKCQPYALTQVERQYNVYQSIMYLSKNKISGSIVECGVFKGGSSIMAALTLVWQKDIKRNMYLYDTYQGMTKPSANDIDLYGEKAINTWMKMRQGDFSSWTKASLDEVKQNMGITKYPKSKLKFIVGKVEDTIPKTMPKKIALLRLDTDWYESTKHELEHLYPRLVPGGILIIDDYGHFAGAKKAVDEYFNSINSKIYLHRIDYTARLVVKGVAGV